MRSESAIGDMARTDYIDSLVYALRYYNVQVVDVNNKYRSVLDIVNDLAAIWPSVRLYEVPERALFEEFGNDIYSSFGSRKARYPCHTNAAQADEYDNIDDAILKEFLESFERTASHMGGGRQ